MPRLGCTNKFITETGQILHENTAKAFFRRTGRRSVIIRQVKIRDTGIKRAVNKPTGVLKIIRQRQNYAKAPGKREEAATSCARSGGRLRGYSGRDLEDNSSERKRGNYRG